MAKKVNAKAKVTEEFIEPDEPQVTVIEFVREWYLRMRPRKWIVRKVAKTFALTERMAYYYVERIEDEYAVHTEAERENEIAQWLAKLDKLEAEYLEIAQLARDDGDLVVVKQCQDSKLVLHRERAKFRGLYAPERTETKHLVEVSDAELLAEMREVVKQLAPEERKLLLEEPIEVEAVAVEPEPDDA